MVRLQPHGYAWPVCGRFNLTKPQEVEARFGLVDWHERRIEVGFNIAPTEEILTIVQPGQGAPVAQLAIWGLAPWWLEPGRRKRPLINARAETVASSGLFRSALARTRCLILATGFYEWRADPGGGKSPTHIRLRGGEPFAFAGLWLPGEDGRPTATIITTRPNELVQSIHSRMLVLLQPEDEALWLDPDVTEAELVLPLLRPYPADAMEASAVEGTRDLRELDQDPALAYRTPFASPEVRRSSAVPQPHRKHRLPLPDDGPADAVPESTTRFPDRARGGLPG